MMQAPTADAPTIPPRAGLRDGLIVPATELNDAEILADRTRQWALSAIARSEYVDPYVAPAVRRIVWVSIHVPPTPYLVARMKITLDLTAVSGWKEVDAVQLVGAN